MSDTEFIREVDEELRREKLKGLWDRFGIYVIAAAVLVVVFTGGYRGWQYWQNSTAKEAGDTFMAGVQLARDGQHAEAAEKLTEFAAKAPGGYKLLARFRAASEKAAADDRAGAIAAFDAIAADGSVAEIYRDLAKIRAGYLAVDTEDRAAIEKRLKPLAAPKNPMHGAAREILGLAAWKADALKDAEGYFDQIAQDATSTRDVLLRAHTMLAVIRSQLKSDEAKPADKKPADKPGTAATSGEAGEKGE